MHLTVIYDYTYITSIRACQRTTLHLLHYTLEDCRHEAHIDSTTYNGIDEYELTAPLQLYLLTRLHVDLNFLTIELVCRWIRHTVCVWLNNKMNLTKLTSTTRLLLMAILSLSTLSDSLTIWNLWLDEIDHNLLVVLQTPLQSAEVELTLTMNDDLTKLLTLLYNPCRIFLTHSGKCSHKFLCLSLILCLDSTRELWVRILDEVKSVLTILTVESIASLDILQLNSTADITSLKLINRHTVSTSTYIYLTDTLLRATIRITEVITRLDASAHNLEVLYLTNMWLYACLEEINRLWSIYIDRHFLTTCIVNLRHLVNERNNVAKELHQTTDTHTLNCTNAEYWED